MYTKPMVTIELAEYEELKKQSNSEAEVYSQEDVNRLELATGHVLTTLINPMRIQSMNPMSVSTTEDLIKDIFYRKGVNVTIDHNKIVTVNLIKK